MRDKLYKPYATDTRPLKFPPLSPERVQHPDMLDEADLSVGLKVTLHHGPVNSLLLYRVVGFPEDGKVTLQRVASTDIDPSPYHLTDLGMRPYKGGLWNPSNYLTRTAADLAGGPLG